MISPFDEYTPITKKRNSQKRQLVRFRQFFTIANADTVKENTKKVAAT